jgi:soluble lytic murein transglycosylase-like protein
MPLPGPRAGRARSCKGSIAALCAVAACLTPSSVAADIVRLNGGRTLSVKAHREDGQSIVLTLRAGGEIVCPRSLVAEILPDEVPYPEPEPVAVVDLPSVTREEPGPFGDLIAAAAERHGVSPGLVQAVIEVESNFEHRARSRKGAMGLMQLMPSTARQYAVANPYDPRSNIDAGTRHLRMLLDRFDVSRALAAYNAGEGAVRRFGGIPPYPETRSYVRRILRLVEAAR